jgi:hypothetical protein
LLVEHGVFTLTFTVPAEARAGARTVTCVLLSDETIVAVSEPNKTEVKLSNPVPVTMTLVPPEVAPVDGDTEDTLVVHDDVTCMEGLTVNRFE